MRRFITTGWALAALAALVPAARAAGQVDGAEVQALAVESSAGRAEVIVRLSGPVDVRDFTLASPHRVVLDLRGARATALAGTRYDGQPRAGLRNVRLAQNTADVARLVLEFDAAPAYRVERDGDALKVSWAAPAEFAAWRAGGDALPRRVSSLAARPALPAAALEAPAPEPAADDPADVAIEVRPTVAARAPLGARTEQPRITATYDKASVADVVAGFAAFSGRTIILGKDVKGEVTAEIKDQPWHLAFQAILAAQGLSAQEMAGGIIRVDDPKTLSAIDSLEPTETQVIRVNYAQASALSKTVESVLTKGKGRVVADTGTNSLIITDSRARMQDIGAFVKSLDIRTPQIAIQAKIVFVDRTHVEELGLKYDIGSRTQFYNQLVQRPNPATGEPYRPLENVIDLGGNQLAAIGNAGSNLIGSALDLVYSTALGGFSVTAFLQALERNELSDIQAEPTITTLDNVEADILVGEEIPLRVVDVSTVGQVGTAPRATVQFRETGIRLTVRPHVTNDRRILMNLKTERSNVFPLAAADLGFIFQKQTAANRLLVDDGETAVIGGLTVTEVTKQRSGIPLLSGLPIVGPLFGFTRNNERRRDLIILVTPRVVDQPVAEE